MRILVCGGRDYGDKEKVYHILGGLQQVQEIIEGGARGADSLAEQYANDNSIPVRRFDADWKSFGRAAGPIRNKQMLEEGKPDMVIAFPGGKGTAHMVKIAKEANIPVKEII